MTNARRQLKRSVGRPTKRPKPRRSRVRFITAAEARRRAERHVLKRVFKGAKVRDGKRANWHVYDQTGKLAGKEVWLVYPKPDQREIAVLRSSEIIVVCKRTGRALYEGTANDEG